MYPHACRGLYLAMQGVQHFRYRITKKTDQKGTISALKFISSKRRTPACPIYQAKLEWRYVIHHCRHASLVAWSRQLGRGVICSFAWLSDCLACHLVSSCFITSFSSSEVPAR